MKHKLLPIILVFYSVSPYPYMQKQKTSLATYGTAVLPKTLQAAPVQKKIPIS